MKKIFIGLVFLIAGFFINIGIGRLDILPDPLGFYFIFKGLTEDTKDYWRFHDYAKHAKILILISSVSFLLLLFQNLGTPVQIIGVIAGIAEEIYLYWLVYKIIDELRMVGFERQVELMVEKLEKLWNAVIAFMMLAVLFLWVPPIAIILELVSLIISFVFLAKFKKTTDVYYASMEK
ncbi:MAG: hypothetical protein IKJ57_07005 [Oscillospiraceae bacterium]|nr:hypothetical protein [Oscillospiraceae bacterium]